MTAAGFDFTKSATDAVPELDLDRTSPCFTGASPCTFMLRLVGTARLGVLSQP